MKSIGITARFLSLVLLSCLIGICCYVYHNYTTYNSIKLSVKNDASIEYGSANYNIRDYIEKIEGNIVSIKSDIDTSVVGNQEVLVEVKKEGVKKVIPLVISVVDTVSPVIQLKEERISITQGDEFDFNSNIGSVRDEIDGDLPYLGDSNNDSKLFYNFNFDSNTIQDVGEHEVKVLAKDKNGNETVTNFILEVKERPPEPVVVNVPSQPIYSNLPANPSGGDLVSIAYSLVGSPYISGSNGPYGFDCSGFVQYVYSRVGIAVSRSSSTQIFDGVGVSYEDAQPGDILSWGYYDGAPTHSALYIGNGQMIHATNPRQGVIASDVAAWTRGSGTHVIAVRRIQ